MLHRFLSGCRKAAIAAPFVLWAGSAGAAPVQYDNFDTPETPQVYAIGMIDPNPTILQSAAPDMLGGQRDVMIEVAGVPTPVSAMGSIGGGLFVFGSSEPGATAYLQYDGIDLETGTSLTNVYGLTSDLTSAGSQFGFTFRFQGLDSGPSADALEIKIDVTGPSGSATYSGTVPDGATPFWHFVSFGSFTGDPGFQFDDATSVEVTFNPLARTDVDFELEFFGTNVPEPASVALAGAAAGAIVWFLLRRRV